VDALLREILGCDLEHRPFVGSAPEDEGERHVERHVDRLPVLKRIPMLHVIRHGETIGAVEEAVQEEPEIGRTCRLNPPVRIARKERYASRHRRSSESRACVRAGSWDSRRV
jgi:hypothetical protein